MQDMCSCEGFADSRLCSLILKDCFCLHCHLLDGYIIGRKVRESVDDLTILLHFCPQRAEAEELHPRGCRAEGEAGAQSKTCIR